MSGGKKGGIQFSFFNHGGNFRVSSEEYMSYSEDNEMYNIEGNIGFYSIHVPYLGKNSEPECKYEKNKCIVCHHPKRLHEEAESIG